MLRVTEVFFWTSLIILFYTYIGYPLLLIILTGLKRLVKHQEKKIIPAELPAATLIITVFNEENILEEKIRNIALLDYPSDLLKVIFITDGSDDNSVNILSKHPQFELLHEPRRRGKLAAMNRAIDFVNTDIVIFNDANGFLNTTSIKNIVRHYADPKVGAVSGEKRILQAAGQPHEGEGMYWQYESKLKKLDAELLTVVGAAGELFSIRTNLYQKLENVIIEDFVQSLLLCERGYVVRYEPDAYSEELPSLNVEDEIERKIRISAGGFQAIVRLKSLLNVFKHPLLTFLYVSHRVLRWTVCPPSLLIFFVSTWLMYDLAGIDFYLLFGVAQAVFYAAAIMGWFFAKKQVKYRLFHLPFYFLMMNWCVFGGFYRFITGKQGEIWKKASRTEK